MIFNRQKPFLILASVLVLTLAVIGVTRFGLGGSFLDAEGAIYSLTKDSNSERLTESSSYTSGDTVLKTNLGNNVGFHFENIKNYADGFVTIASDGFFENTTPMNSVTSIRISFSGGYVKVYAGWYTGNTVEYLMNTVQTSSGTVSFHGEYIPNFVKIAPYDGEISISSIQYDYSCSESPIPSDWYHPTLSFYDGNSTLIQRVNTTRGQELDLTMAYCNLIKSQSGNFFGGWYRNTKYSGTRETNYIVDGWETFSPFIYKPTRALMNYYMSQGEISSSDDGYNATVSRYSDSTISLKGTYLGYSFNIRGNNGSFEQRTTQNLYDTNTQTVIPSGTLVQSGTCALSYSFSIESSSYFRFNVSSYSTTVNYSYNSSFRSNSNSNTALSNFISFYKNSHSLIPYVWTLEDVMDYHYYS